MSQNIIGKILLGQFRVDAFIASGGMGAVYRVWDLKRNVPLAMKVLHSELADDPAIFKRFQREANALKKLAHPNIVTFYGLYQTQDFAFLLERFVDGPSLSEILRQRQGKPLPVGETLVYLKALCAALGYAHANGVVHCDVKPGNVMVDRGGIYLTDFGIARHAESTTTTMAGAGTSAYMAPEQIRGETVSPATDVYALGVMLFEMLTGQRPFRGTEPGLEKGGTTVNERIRYGHLTLAPPDPRSLNSNLPAGWSDLILKALSKQPELRFQSTQEFFAAASSAAGQGDGSIPDRVEFPSGEESEPPFLPAAPEPAGTKKRSPSYLLGGMVVAIGVIAVAILAAVALGWHPDMTQMLQPKPNTVSTLPRLPQPDAPDTPDIPLQDCYYTIKSGDVLSTIALKLRTTYQDAICSPDSAAEGCNIQNNPNNLRPGYIIIFHNVLPPLCQDNGDGVQPPAPIEIPTATSISIETPIPTATSIPTETLIPTAADTLSPEEFIRGYFRAISESNYTQAWDMLSDHFKNLHNSSGYQPFVDWWSTIDQVEVLSVNVKSQSANSAQLEAELAYYFKNGQVDSYDLMEFDLLYDSSVGSWFIDDSRLIKGAR
jgi:hypothetical protein